MSEPVVAIVGRPNVGKSTLFNRIIGRRQAIVDDKPGVTRDRIYSVTEWNGKQFLLVDTGGYLPGSSDVIESAVREQVEIAMEEANIILCIVDARIGITSTDEQMAQLLQKAKKDVILVVNKVDDQRDFLEVGQFYNLGLDEPVPVSAMIGKRTGDLLDKITEKLQEHTVTEEDEDVIKLAVIGKENVGKSSLVNMLLNRQRQIVTDIPGTTRDSIDSAFKYKNRQYLLIDTAGLKRRAKIKENILFYSNLRTYRSIQRADVVLCMIDANDGITRQDINILMETAEERRGLLLVVNKWDLVAKDAYSADIIKKEIRERLGILRYIPSIFAFCSNCAICSSVDVIPILASTIQRIIFASSIAISTCSRTALSITSEEPGRYPPVSTSRNCFPFHSVTE